LSSGSFLDGLLTSGSDIDLCPILDDMDPDLETGELEKRFKASSRIDGKLRRREMRSAPLW